MIIRYYIIPEVHEANDGMEKHIHEMISHGFELPNQIIPSESQNTERPVRLVTLLLKQQKKYIKGGWYNNSVTFHKLSIFFNEPENSYLINEDN